MTELNRPGFHSLAAIVAFETVRVGATRSIGVIRQNFLKYRGNVYILGKMLQIASHPVATRRTRLHNAGHGQ